MVENIFRKIGVLGSLLMLIILGSILTTSHFATAYVRYGPAAQLGTGDIKTLHILDSTILSADMANYNSPNFSQFHYRKSDGDELGNSASGLNH